MSALTNNSMSPISNESLSGDNLVSLNSSLNLNRIPTFVCQRCLRILDLHPSLAEINIKELEKPGFDLLKVLEKVDTHQLFDQKVHSGQGRDGLSMSLASPNISPHSHHDSRSSIAVTNLGSSTYTNSLSPPVDAIHGRKRKNEAGLARTLTSFTNLFKSNPQPSPTSPSQQNTSSSSSIIVNRPSTPSTQPNNTLSIPNNFTSNRSSISSSSSSSYSSHSPISTSANKLSSSKDNNEESEQLNEQTTQTNDFGFQNAASSPNDPSLQIQENSSNINASKRKNSSNSIGISPEKQDEEEEQDINLENVSKIHQIENPLKSENNQFEHDIKTKNDTDQMIRNDEDDEEDELASLVSKRISIDSLIQPQLHNDLSNANIHDSTASTTSKISVYPAKVESSTSSINIKPTKNITIDHNKYQSNHKSKFTDSHPEAIISMPSTHLDQIHHSSSDFDLEKSSSPQQSNTIASPLASSATLSADDDYWNLIGSDSIIGVGSVSRAAMREKSKGLSFLPRGWRTLRGPPPGFVAPETSKRGQIRDLTAAGSSSKPFLQVPVRKMGFIFEQAILETQLDLPLCTECSKDVVGALEEDIDDIQADIQQFELQLRLLEHPFFQEDHFGDEMQRMEAQISSYNAQIEETQQRLKVIEQQEYLLRIQDRELLMSKSEYWRQFEIHAADREAMLENMISAHNRLSHATRWLDLVRSSSVVNDAFHISIELHLATIGNLRIGRLPSAPVDWPEISAALGLALHLLHEMAVRAGFTFTKYKPIIEGSYSGLYKMPNGGILTLHSEADISLVRLLQFQGVNTALGAFVECVQELSEHIKTQDKSFTLPFPISKDLVNGNSVKRAWNSTGATWSAALRSLMANLKYILAWEAKKGICI